MIEQGEVIKIEKNNAVVAFQRKTACDKCGMCAFGKNDMKVKLTLKNNVNAKVGDIVEVTMGDRFVLTSALIVYIIPLLLVGAGIGIGIGFKLAEYVQIILAFAGFVAGFALSALIDKKIKKRTNFSPSITRIVAEEEDFEENKDDE